MTANGKALPRQDEPPFVHPSNQLLLSPICLAGTAEDLEQPSILPWSPPLCPQIVPPICGVESRREVTCLYRAVDIRISTCPSPISFFCNLECPQTFRQLWKIVVDFKRLSIASHWHPNWPAREVSYFPQTFSPSGDSCKMHGLYLPPGKDNTLFRLQLLFREYNALIRTYSKKVTRNQDRWSSSSPCPSFNLASLLSNSKYLSAPGCCHEANWRCLSGDFASMTGVRPSRFCQALLCC